MILAVYITNMQTLRRRKKENLFSLMTTKFTAWIGLQKIRIHWNFWFIFKIQTILQRTSLHIFDWVVKSLIDLASMSCLI